MIKKIALTAVASLALSAGAAFAAGGGGHIHDVQFSFEGPFGTYDQMQLQRGLSRDGGVTVGQQLHQPKIIQRCDVE